MPVWWVMNLQAYHRLFDAAGLEIVARGRPFLVKRGAGNADASGGGGSRYRRLRQTVASRVGNLHAWVSARAPQS